MSHLALDARHLCKMNYLHLDCAVILLLQYCRTAGECRSNYSYIVRNYGTRVHCCGKRCAENTKLFSDVES